MRRDSKRFVKNVFQLLCTLFSWLSQLINYIVVGVYCTASDRSVLFSLSCGKDLRLPSDINWLQSPDMKGNKTSILNSAYV